MAKNSSFIVKIYSCLFVLYPLLSNYGYRSLQLDFGTILLLLFFCSAFLASKHKESLLKFPKYFLFFFIYMIITRFIFADSYGPTSLFSLGFIFFGLLLAGTFNLLNIDVVLSFYRKVVFVCCAFFLFQEIMYIALGYRISGIISWLPYYNEIDIGEQIAIAPRSTSLFSEPAHFGQYIFPLLVIESLYFKSFYRSLILVVFLFLSESGNSMILLLLYLVYMFIYYWQRVSLWKKVMIVFLLLPLLALGSYEYAKSEGGEKMLGRQEELVDDRRASSGFIRVWRGYFVYDDLPTFYKIVGLNNASKIKNTIDKSKVSWAFLNEKDTYMNGIQSVLISGGILGLLLFFCFMKSLFYNSPCGKLIALSFIVLSFISSTYLNATMLFYLSFSLLFQKKYMLILK